jgi:hypothetical protein
MEVVVLNKDSIEWKNAPTWVLLGMWGMKSRRTALIFEYFCFAVGFMGFLSSFVLPEATLTTLLLGSAYWYAITIRWIDNAKLWIPST